METAATRATAAAATNCGSERVRNGDMWYGTRWAVGELSIVAPAESEALYGDHLATQRQQRQQQQRLEHGWELKRTETHR